LDTLDREKTSSSRAGITTVALQSPQHRPSLTGCALWPWVQVPMVSMSSPQIEQFMCVSFFSG
jgi:hypothetical protein